jgi:hypothetical protein
MTSSVLNEAKVFFVFKHQEVKMYEGMEAKIKEF